MNLQIKYNQDKDGVKYAPITVPQAVRWSNGDDLDDKLSEKANKVDNPTSGNFAALDANGNIVDSGHKHSDYLTQHQSLANYIQKSNTSGLVKNDGTIDTNTYLTQHQDISGKEDTSNKVTSWQVTPDDTHYPSEKLVKDSIKLVEISYSTATFTETSSIISGGGVPYFIINDNCYIFNSKDSTKIWFAQLGLFGSFRFKCLIPSNDWVDRSIYTEAINNKKATITGNEASNTYYPTTKAVADYAEKKTDIVAPVNTTDATLPITTLSCEVGKYYRIDVAVDTLAVTLPAVTDTTHISNIVFMLTAGTTPAVTFTAPSGINVYYQDGFEIESGSTYEINALFNGAAWIVASVKINVE